MEVVNAVLQRERQAETRPIGGQLSLNRTQRCRQGQVGFTAALLTDGGFRLVVHRPDGVVASGLNRLLSVNLGIPAHATTSLMQPLILLIVGPPIAAQSDGRVMAVPFF